MPSALIPFCAFASEEGMSMIDNFPFPVCTMFQPTILDGQQCYQLESDLLSGRGEDHGLLFMIDVNEERSEQPQVNMAPTKENNRKPARNEFKKFLIEKAEHFGSGLGGAKIYIDTLSPYYGFNPGSYVLTNVKKITVTDKLIGLSMEQKQCMDDVYEKCIARNLLKNGKETSGCSYFGLSMATNMEVDVKITIFYDFKYQSYPNTGQTLV